MIKLASLLFGVLTLGASRRLIYRLDFPKWGISLALFLTGASWTLAVASVNGLETTLSAWLMTMLVARLITGDAISRPLNTAVIAAGVVLARPEGIGIVAVLALTALLTKGSSSSAWRSIAWAVGGLGAAIAATLVRLVYYGEFLPNTYYAKHAALWLSMQRGWRYLLSSVALLESSTFTPQGRLSIEIKILAGVFGAVLLVGIAVTVVRRPRVLFATVAVIAQICVILAAGGDWMSGGRFVAPIAPLLAIIQTVGVIAIVNLVATHSSGATGAPVFVRGVLAAFLGLAGLAGALSVKNPIWDSHWKFDTASLFAASHGAGVPTVVWMDGAAVLGCAQPNDVIAYSEVGYAGFVHQDLRFVDTRGLTDRAIARNASSSDKSNVGVTDFSWRSPRSPVGAEILKERADFILTFDQNVSIGKVLAGTYREVGYKQIPPRQFPFFLYQRAGRHCPAPGFIAYRTPARSPGTG